MLLDMYFYPQPSRFKRQNPDDRVITPSVAVAPPLFDAINKNGLVLFLLVNSLSLSIANLESNFETYRQM